MGKIYITGDLNSRVANENDFLHLNTYLDRNIDFLYDNNNIPLRLNQDTVIDHNGRRLLQLCQSTDLLIANGRMFEDQGDFTFCSHMGLSTVDYLLLNFHDFDTLDSFCVSLFNEYSDHAPLMFSLITRPIQYNVQGQTTPDELINNDRNNFRWKSENIPRFRSIISDNSHVLDHLTDRLADDSPDHVVKSFTDTLYEWAVQSCGTDPIHRPTIPTRSKRINKPWFNAQCHELKHQFKNARNTFNRNKNDENRRNFVRLRTKYNKVKQKARSTYKYNEGMKISRLANSNPRTFWKKLKSFNKKKQPKPSNLSLDDLFIHFKNMFGNDNQETDENDINNQAENVTQDEELDCNITEAELRSAVMSQNNNKSPGEDSLVAEIFKSNYDLLNPFLLKLYNKLFDSGQYPDSWANGIIAPVFKKGDLNDAKNYRGITLINILAKIYSQILLNRLTNWSQKYDKIDQKQFGFQKGKSITDCLFILHSVISKVLNAGQKLYCIFIDYMLCFDKINRSFLFRKLLNEQISTKFVNAIKTMYTVVRSCVRYNHSQSEYFISNIGLKQGDPSSPLLFMFFVNDLAQNINTDLDGNHTINELKYFLLLYADDQALFATSPTTLQLMINDLVSYCDTWGLKINTEKTKVMIFEKGRHTMYTFYIYDTAIEVVNSFKYLGITLFKNGGWFRSQKLISQHAARALCGLYNILNNVELPIEQKFKLFDTLVGSILNFGAEIWGNHNATDIEQIHTKFIRSILRVKRSTNLNALYGETGRLPLSVFRKFIIIKYWIKILKLPDSSLVKQAYLFLKADADIGRSYNGTNWANNVKLILENHGLNNIWHNQINVNFTFETIKQRISDMYLQKWYSDINNSPRLQSYCIFKHDYNIEHYLSCVKDIKYRVALTRLRTSSHDLFIENDRYRNIPRDQRHCKSCNMKTTETEYHFILVCPRYRELRTKYFRTYFCHWPTIRKFETLLSKNSKKEINQLSKYIYYANNLRIK